MVTEKKEFYSIPTMKVFTDLLRERKAQHEKWGPQSYPTTLDHNLGTPMNPMRAAEEVEIPTANRAKQLCDRNQKEQRWQFILVEELAEVVEAAQVGSIEDLKKELIQLAACCVAWVEDLNT